MRTYKRKTLLNRDRRMAVAIRLRAEGLSLRQIGARLYVNHQTVANDLARWEQERSSMPLKIVRLSKPAVENVPPRGEDSTPAVDSGAEADEPETAVTGRVHLALHQDATLGSCNLRRRRRPEELTMDPGLVTCGNCKRTTLYQAAVRVTEQIAVL